MDNNYVDLDEIKNGFIFASNDEISLLLPDWYEGVDEFYEIIKNDTKEVVGTILYKYENSSVVGNIEYFIYEYFRDNKYARKALILLAENLYKLDSSDLYISILPNNIASIKTALNAGAVFERKVKIPKNYIFSCDGKYSYANMYVLKSKVPVKSKKIK